MNAQTKQTAASVSEPAMKLDPAINLAEALSRAQADFPPIVKDKIATVKSEKGTYQYQYADLASVLDAVRAPLAKHGLAYTQLIKLQGDGRSILVTRLMHVTGENVEAEWALPTGSPQQVGSALTYARRYCLCAMLGVAAEVDDDDGQAGQSATPAAKPAAKQEQQKPAQQNQQSKPATGGQASGPTFTVLVARVHPLKFARGNDYLAAIEAEFGKAEDKIAFWDANSAEFQQWHTKLVSSATTSRPSPRSVGSARRSPIPSSCSIHRTEADPCLAHSIKRHADRQCRPRS
jgi:hypothetical protein